MIIEDLRAYVSPNYGNGWHFWVRVLAKVLSSPAIHVVMLYRLSALLYRSPLTRPLAFVVRGLSVVWGGTEIHPSVKIGPGLCIVHCQKVVIGPRVTIGRNVRIGQGVTIAGAKGPASFGGEKGIPVIGDNVTVALDSIVLGPVRVGDGAFIGAQSLVLHDVPPRTMVRGSPARVARHLDEPATALHGGEEPGDA